jgi:hypothetical protein
MILSFLKFLPVLIAKMLFGAWLFRVLKLGHFRR